MFGQYFKAYSVIGLFAVLMVGFSFSSGFGAAKDNGHVKMVNQQKPQVNAASTKVEKVLKPSKANVKETKAYLPSQKPNSKISANSPVNATLRSVYLRVFKKENLLEVWMRNPSKQAYELHKSFKICRWSGVLGPKIKEGDKQSPEGLYNLPAKHILWNSSKWPQALNIGYPNVYDLAHQRTGSALLIHGGCRSTGCFAMNNENMAKLYKIVKTARDAGQALVSIHVFPFKMTDKNLALHAKSKWFGFWKSLAPFYQKFERSRQIPRGQLCDKSYLPAENGNLARRQCMPIYSLAGLSKTVLKKHKWIGKALRKQQALQMAGRGRTSTSKAAYAGLNVTTEGGRVRMKLRPHLKVSCNISLSSCRRWVALHKAKLKNGTLSSDLIEFR